MPRLLAKALGPRCSMHACIIITSIISTISTVIAISIGFTSV